MYEKIGISNKIVELAKKTESEIQNEFKQVEEICEYNSLKVLKAFQKYNISDMHFNSTTGYGYGDIGRDTIEKVFADIFNVEDSLVRTQFISGTHALTVALFAYLRPNDTFLSICGKPYDTLDEVIGITENNSSLKSYGVKYEQIDLKEDDFNYEEIEKRVSQNDIKLIEIQRSRGYALRSSISLDKIQEVIKVIRQVNKTSIIMVDNCYGEFVDKIEPTEIGADVVVGSLIKNILQGIFMAPSVVANSLKTAIFASKMLENLGYKTNPRYDEKRTDIVQTIEFGNPEKLVKYCQGIQMGSPIDSSSIPEPWDMPGYTDKIIMASGAFTQGSSIELSCDAPIREPYIAFMQGGLTYEYGKIGVMRAIENIL